MMNHTWSQHEVFVFGSNRAGRHGAGAALFAVMNAGAVRGKGEGHFGRSYALPTKDEHLRTLTLFEIEKHVERFLEYAHEHISTDFFVTRIGCGLAGYSDQEIAPMFHNAPPNCRLPPEWRKIHRAA